MCTYCDDSEYFRAREGSAGTLGLWFAVPDA
jgi:hypothetical protein